METYPGVIQSKAVLLSLRLIRDPGTACHLLPFTTEGFYLMVQCSCLSSSCHIHILMDKKSAKTVHAFLSKALSRSCTYYFYLYAFG